MYQLYLVSLRDSRSFDAQEGTPPPLIESSALAAIVTGLLGVGGMRSYDKQGGVNKDSLK